MRVNPYESPNACREPRPKRSILLPLLGLFVGMELIGAPSITLVALWFGVDRTGNPVWMPPIVLAAAALAGAVLLPWLVHACVPRSLKESPGDEERSNRSTCGTG